MPAQIAIMALITTTWVTYESYLDVKDLLRGYSVPLIKNEDEWVSNITISSNDNSISNVTGDLITGDKEDDGPINDQGGKGQLKMFNYDDYLRLNLLGLGNEINLVNGAKDLIAHNVKTYESADFDYNSKYSSVSVSVSAGMGMLFNLSDFFGGGYKQDLKFDEIKLEKGYD